MVSTSDMALKSKWEYIATIEKEKIKVGLGMHFWEDQKCRKWWWIFCNEELTLVEHSSPKTIKPGGFIFLAFGDLKLISLLKLIITSDCISYLSIHIQCHIYFFIQQSCEDYPVAVLCDVCQLCGRGGDQSAHGAGTDHTVTSWLFKLSNYISIQIQFPNSLSALVPLK